MRGAISLFEVTRFTVLPGVFMEHPIVQANGPLWTLQYEMSFYFVILCMGVVGLLPQRWPMLIVFGICALVAHFEWGKTISWHWTPVEYIAPFLIFFSVGSIAYLYRTRIPMHPLLAAAALSVVGASCFFGGLGIAVFAPMLCFLLLWLCLAPFMDASFLTRSGDYSYGLYIWGWPCQKLVFDVLGTDTSVWIHLLCSILLSFGAAIISWHWVEKRALRWKRAGSRVRSILSSPS